MKNDLESIRHGEGQFTLKQRLCPACGEPAHAMQVATTGMAHIYNDHAEDVEFQFNGHTDIANFRGMIVLNQEGQIIVGCRSGHLWVTEFKVLNGKKK